MLEIVKVPPGDLQIQRLPEDEFPCLECGIAADDETNGCGKDCAKKFGREMKRIYRRIRIADTGETGEGAFLDQGSFKPPVEGEQSETEHFVVGMYMGMLLPEVPTSQWKDSSYVVPINGANYEIEEKRIPNGFSPRWGGPYKPLPRISRTRYQVATTKPVYDTETYTVMIDALEIGNWTRYINSSCQPNLFISAEQVGKRRLMVFKPLREIETGEELTFYYETEFFRDRNIKCKCRAHRTPHDPRNLQDDQADEISERLPPGLRAFQSPAPAPAPPPRRARKQRPPREPPRTINNRKRAWDDLDDGDPSDDFDFMTSHSAPKRPRRRL